MSCGAAAEGAGGGLGSLPADGVGGPLPPPLATCCAGNLAAVAMGPLPWLHRTAVTRTHDTVRPNRMEAIERYVMLLIRGC